MPESSRAVHRARQRAVKAPGDDAILLPPRDKPTRQRKETKTERRARRKEQRQRLKRKRNPNNSGGRGGYG